MQIQPPRPRRSRRCATRKLCELCFVRGWEKLGFGPVKHGLFSHFASLSFLFAPYRIGRSHEKSWWRSVRVLTCKYVSESEYSGVRLIEQASKRGFLLQEAVKSGLFDAHLNIFFL